MEGGVRSRGVRAREWGMEGGCIEGRMEGGGTEVGYEKRCYGRGYGRKDTGEGYVPAMTVASDVSELGL